MDTAEDLLNSPDYFTCDRLRCRMPKMTCSANQDVAAGKRVHFDAYHGVSVATMTRRDTCIECEQGRQIKQEFEAMEKGTCSNCKRSDLAIVPGKEGICFSCQRFAVNTTGDERKRKLALAAEKYGQKEIHRGGRKVKTAPNQAGYLSQLPPEIEAKIKKSIKNLGDKMKKESNPRPEDVGAIKPAPPPAPPSIEHAAPADNKISVVVEHYDVIPVPFSPDDRPLYEYLVKRAKDEYRTPHQQILYMLDCNRQADLEAGSGTPGY